MTSDTQDIDIITIDKLIKKLTILKKKNPRAVNVVVNFDDVQIFESTLHNVYMNFATHEVILYCGYRSSRNNGKFMRGPLYHLEEEELVLAEEELA